jgi:hypothetical protein
VQIRELKTLPDMLVLAFKVPSCGRLEADES